MAEAAPLIIPLGDTWIYQYPGWTTTSYADGSFLIARHDDVAGLGQEVTRRELGYASVDEMNVQHDPSHSFLAGCLGLPYSPTLYARAHGEDHPLAALEEGAVRELTRFAVALGVNLIERVQWLSRVLHQA